MDWFRYDRDLRHEIVNVGVNMVQMYLSPNEGEK